MTEEQSQTHHLNQSLDKRLLELTALFEVSRSLASMLNLHAILENILRISMGQMLIGRGMILLQQHDGGLFTVETLKGIPRNLLGKVIEIDDPPGCSITIEQACDQYEWAEFFKTFEMDLLTPLNSSKGAIGILAFGKKINEEPYSEEEIEFLDSLSNIASTSVANGLMVEEIQDVNRRLDRKIQQLNTIFDISRELNTTLDRGKIASLLSFAVMGELLVNKCVILTKENGCISRLISKGVDYDFEDDPSLCEISEPFPLEDTDQFQAYQDKGLAGVVPMRIQQQTKGVLLVGNKITGGAFTEADFEFLKTLGNQAMTSLENARLFEDALEKQRLEEELNLARSIQQGLFPEQMPDVEGYEIVGSNTPSRQVGGDYYDVIPIDENRYGVAIGDVAGKGAGAALLMATLQASLQALVPSCIPINEMMARVNRLVYQNTAIDKYITFFYSELNCKAHTLTYCNAGHNFPYHVKKNGSVTELSEGGLILGMMPDVEFQLMTVPVEPGDRIVLFTDGITEAMDEAENEFGEERLKELVRRTDNESAAALIDLIVHEVKEYSQLETQADDMTLVVVKRNH
jgi:sigma-B regulation protein RsbU (phosphoserine phosphatase)